MQEFTFIHDLLSPLADNDYAQALSNDGAVLPGSDGQSWVITTDTIIQDVHFTSDTPAEYVAQKMLRVNVSDIVAMGAKASYYSMALSFSEGTDEAWLRQFVVGLQADQTLYGLQLLGGDTTVHAGGLVATCTMMGVLESGQSSLSRKGAQEGDNIYVTGTIGDAALGLQLALGKAEWQLSEQEKAYLLHRYYVPQPRCSHTKTIASFAHSGLDVSDGLLQDIGHLTSKQGLGAELKQASIPLSAAASKVLAQDISAWEYIFAGGDDYEIAFTASPAYHQEIMVMEGMSEVPIACVGKVQGAELTVVDFHGQAIACDVKGFQHELFSQPL